MARQVLVLGGTGWLGAAIARAGVRRGDQVTCLARGESGAVPAGARHVVSDRRSTGAYDAVAGRRWDLVLDVSWQPAQVRGAVRALADRADRWVYVSSISVYADHATPGQDETAALVPGLGEVDEATGAEYPAAKVSCETSCREAVDPERLVVARAGLIVGYGDPTDRFGYWPARFDRAAEGEPVLVPPPTTPVQVIDVHDLATWLVEAPAAGAAGTLDAVGPRLVFGDVAGACCSVLGRSPQLVSPGSAWLTGHDVAPWAGPESLPLWLPPSHAGITARPGLAAQAAGLTCRPLASSVLDALRWEREQGVERSRVAGLSPAQEAALLEDYLHPH